jgi:hypothetical protein
MFGDDGERQPARFFGPAPAQSKKHRERDYGKARNGVTDREHIADSQRGEYDRRC